MLLALRNKLFVYLFFFHRFQYINADAMAAPESWPKIVTLSRLPPKMLIYLQIHSSAKTTSTKPTFPGISPVLVDKKPNGPKRYWTATKTISFSKKFNGRTLCAPFWNWPPCMYTITVWFASGFNYSHKNLIIELKNIGFWC